MSETITLSDIQRARQRIGSTVRRTPQVISSTLSEALRTNIYCKLEMFQKTGSFKVRGATNLLSSLGAEERRRGKWSTRTETYGRLTATKTHWIVWGKIDAFEGKKKVFTKEFNEKIERKLQ